MKLYVIFGQREGEPPEALDVMDEYGYDENPSWLRQRLGVHRENTDLDAVEIVEIELERGALRAIKEKLVGTLSVRARATQAQAPEGE